jgi:uncharacterized membrane protein YkoI
MISKTRRNVTTGAIALGALVGSAFIANAVSNAPTTVASATAGAAAAAPATTVPTPAENDGADEATENHDGKGGRGVDRAAHEAQEATDGSDAALLAKAKITPAQATAAAIAVAPGTADAPDIHERDGVLSYDVRIITATGETEVTVDATTGVATVEAEGGDHHGGRGHGGPGHDGPGRPNDNDEDDAPGTTATTVAPVSS